MQLTVGGNPDISRFQFSCTTSSTKLLMFRRESYVPENIIDMLEKTSQTYPYRSYMLQ